MLRKVKSPALRGLGWYLLGQYITLGTITSVFFQNVLLFRRQCLKSGQNQVWFVKNLKHSGRKVSLWMSVKVIVQLLWLGPF